MDQRESANEGFAIGATAGMTTALKKSTRVSTLCSLPPMSRTEDEGGGSGCVCSYNCPFFPVIEQVKNELLDGAADCFWRCHGVESFRAFFGANRRVNRMLVRPCDVGPPIRGVGGFEHIMVCDQTAGGSDGETTANALPCRAANVRNVVHDKVGFCAIRID